MKAPSFLAYWRLQWLSSIIILPILIQIKNVGLITFSEYLADIGVGYTFINFFKCNLECEIWKLNLELYVCIYILATCLPDGLNLTIIKLNIY